MTKDVFLQVRSVSKTFGSLHPGGRRHAALAPIDLEVNEGEFLSIVGPSGCGKSTLLNVIAGLEEPDSGEILVAGRRIAGPGPDRAMVFQEPGLMPWMTVFQNVEYGLKLGGVAKAERHNRVMHYLRLVHLLRFAGSYPHQLSGGMRQRASIARALALEPKVLLMDEPFSALDSQTREVLQDELQLIWQETGKTIIFVTHHLEEAVLLSDRVLMLSAPPGRTKRLVKVPFDHPRDAAAPGLVAFVAGLRGDMKEEVEAIASAELGEDWRPLVPPGRRGVVGVGEGI